MLVKLDLDLFLQSWYVLPMLLRDWLVVDDFVLLIG
jgi:hypothetical protein